MIQSNANKICCEKKHRQSPTKCQLKEKAMPIQQRLYHTVGMKLVIPKLVGEQQNKQS
jgi:hypothetical protein